MSDYDVKMPLALGTFYERIESVMQEGETLREALTEDQVRDFLRGSIADTFETKDEDTLTVLEALAWEEMSVDEAAS